MDGTLTEPGAIDFSKMYSRNGLKKEDGDMITQIQQMTDPAKRQAAWDVIIEEEMIGCERMQLRPKMSAMLAAMSDARMRVALSTRNCRDAYGRFLLLAKLEQGFFTPAITRDCLDGLNKPDPRVALHILEHWGSSEAEKDSIWFVGDSEDDVLGGKGAGLRTCLIRTNYNKRFAEANPGVVDVQVDSLEEFAETVLGLRL